ncbi:MAG: hypothetical protein ABSF26_16985 [Thermoguttaceae bacterium]|jgi:energy-coupling factor transporter transmembrane protein EcfT
MTVVPSLIVLLVLLLVLAGISALIFYRPTRVVGLLLVGVIFILLTLGWFTASVHVSRGPEVVILDHGGVHRSTAAMGETENGGPPRAATGHQPPATSHQPPAKGPARPEPVKPEPAAKPAAAPKPPQWVGAAPAEIEGVYYMTAKAGPYQTLLECQRDLPAALQVALAEYIDLYLGREAAGRVQLPPDELRQRLVSEQWEEPVASSFGPMVQLHARLAFDQNIKQWIEDEWQQVVVLARLQRVFVALAAVLLVLGIVYLFLRAGSGSRLPRGER